MQTQQLQDPNTLLMELDQIEKSIRTSEAHLETLKDREMLISRIVDEYTRPESTTTSLRPIPVRRGYNYMGEFTRAWTYLDLYLNVLRQLWIDFPEKREEIAASMRSTGYSRSYVSKERSRLFEGKTAAWTMKYSRCLIDGWHVDTNLNSTSIKKLLSIAIKAAGLSLGKDVTIYWNSSIPR